MMLKQHDRIKYCKHKNHYKPVKKQQQEIKDPDSNII